MENYKDTSDFLNDAIEDFNLNLFKYILKKSIIWIILLLILCIGGGFLVIRYSERIYEASASLILKKTPETMKVLGVESILQADDAEIYREIQLLKSSMMIHRVLDSLPLAVSYFNKGRTGLVSSEMYKSSPFEVSNIKVKNNQIYDAPIKIEILNLNSYRLEYLFNDETIELKGKFNVPLIGKHFEIIVSKTGVELERPNLYFIINNEDNQIAHFISKLEVSQVVPQTQSLQIKLKDANTLKALDFTTALINSFISFDKERKVESVGSILRFLRHQIDTFGTRYENIRDTSNNSSLATVFSPDVQIKEIFDNLKLIQEKIDVLEIQSRTLDAIRQSRDKTLESYFGIFAYSKTGVLSDHFFTVLNELKEYQKQKEELLLDYKPNNPSIISINEKIDKTLESLQFQIQKSLQTTQAEKEELKKKYNELNNKLLAIPGTAMEYDRFKKENENSEKFLFNLLDKQSQYLVAEAGIVSDYIILTPPMCSSIPVFPQVKTIRLISIILFLFLTLTLILMRYLMYQFVTSIKDIKKRIKAPVLGVIPKYNEENMARSKIIVTINPKSKISESFRGIRANVQFLSKHDKCKVIATTSTIPGEGKTFVNINLAAIHSVLDKKVLLMDLDMRKPRLAKIFGIQATSGMSTILSGQSELKNCITPTNFKNLDVIVSGPVPPNPSELILNSNLDEVIAELKKTYDFIFIDTPPIGLVTDAMELLAKADVPLYVVRADYTRKEFLGNIDRLIVENKLTKLSIVVNDFGRGASGEMYEYGYGYGYTYSQGEGYYTDDRKSKKESFWSYLKNWKL